MTPINNDRTTIKPLLTAEEIAIELDKRKNDRGTLDVYRVAALIEQFVNRYEAERTKQSYKGVPSVEQVMEVVNPLVIWDGTDLSPGGGDAEAECHRRLTALFSSEQGQGSYSSLQQGLGASASEGGRPTAAAGEDAEHPATPLRADAPAYMQSQSAKLCHRVGSHVFLFAGGDVPEGWPCECGEIKTPAHERA